MTQPTASIIIPTYQRCKELRRILECLSGQTVSPEDFEVIVCIDGSTDGTRSMAESFPAPYRLSCLWAPNRGRAAARNAGIAKAKGEIVILLDDDMAPEPHFVDAHLRAHSGAVRRAVMGAVPISFTQSSPPVVQHIGAKFNAHLEKMARTAGPVTLRDVYIGNFSIQRAVLVEVGDFDESFTEYGNEDLELSVRLARHGVHIVYDARARAYQHYTKDFTGLAQDTVQKGRTAVLLGRKHPGAAADLKLGQYRQGPLVWRCLRAVLLSLTTIWPGTAGTVRWAVATVERMKLPRLSLWYSLALDYFYWLGALSALSTPAGPRKPVHAEER